MGVYSGLVEKTWPGEVRGEKPRTGEDKGFQRPRDPDHWRVGGRHKPLPQRRGWDRSTWVPKKLQGCGDNSQGFPDP